MALDIAFTETGFAVAGLCSRALIDCVVVLARILHASSRTFSKSLASQLAKRKYTATILTAANTDQIVIVTMFAEAYTAMKPILSKTALKAITFGNAI